MKKTSFLKLTFGRYRKPPAKLYSQLRSGRIKNEKVKEILVKLNGQSEQQFQEFVESGGEKNSKDRIYTQRPKPFDNMGFDTEDNSKGQCHLLCFTMGKDKYEFYDKETALFWLMFSEFKNGLILWCINTEYDVNNLFFEFDFLMERFYNKSTFIFGSLAVNRNIRFYDVRNFYSLSARAVGELFGYKKLDFDFGKKRRTNKDGSYIATKKEIKYCYRDAVIAEKAGTFITDKFKDYDIKQAATVASCALQIYLSEYSPVDFSQPPPSRYHLDNDFVFQSYYGGRTEAFHYGRFRGKIKYYDVNSLYPYVMKEFLFPNPFSEIYIGKSDDIENGLIHCRIRIPKSRNIGLLPYRRYADNARNQYKLIFPVGTFEGVWTVSEINNAINNGAVIQEVFQSVEWEESIDLFSEFVTGMYENRMNAKLDSDKKFFKVVMNSLYGKFAEKRRRTRYVPIELGGAFDPIVYDMSQITEEYSPIHQNTIISSTVTSYGRIHLLNLMLEVESKGGTVLYCDTDSVIYEGDFELDSSMELGAVKKEADLVEVEILGAKYYRTKEVDGTETFVCKGVPKEQQYKMFGKEKRADWVSPMRYRESIRRGLQANVWSPRSKRSMTMYDKRKVKSDGKTVPIILTS